MSTGAIQALCAAVVCGMAVAGAIVRFGRREQRVDAAIERLTWLVDWLVETHTNPPGGNRDALFIPRHDEIPPRRRRPG